MYEKLTKWIPEMGPYSCPSWMWPPHIEKFMYEVCKFQCSFDCSECLTPAEISLAASDKEFLDSLQGETIIAAMRAVYGADRICEGTVNFFAGSGAFLKFLVRLRELDEGKAVVPPKKSYDFHKRVAESKRQEEERRRREEKEREIAARAAEREAKLQADLDQARKNGDDDNERDSQFDWHKIITVGRYSMRADVLFAYCLVLLAVFACLIIGTIAVLCGR